MLGESILLATSTTATATMSTIPTGEDSPSTNISLTAYCMRSDGVSGSGNDVYYFSYGRILRSPYTDWDDHAYLVNSYGVGYNHGDVAGNSYGKNEATLIHQMYQKRLRSPFTGDTIIAYFVRPSGVIGDNHYYVGGSYGYRESPCTDDNYGPWYVRSSGGVDYGEGIVYSYGLFFRTEIQQYKRIR